jgi:hypothetical protein
LKDRYWEQERLDGYADAMRAAGLKPAPCVPFAFDDVNRLPLPKRFKVLKSMAISKLLELGYGRDATVNAECRMQNAECEMQNAECEMQNAECRMQNGPDALLCLTDNFARVAIAAMRELGLEPHRDILVAGYDNIAPGAELGAFEAEAPDVTIDKHNERTAAEMAALLAARLAGELPPAPQCREHEFELVERENAGGQPHGVLPPAVSPPPPSRRGDECTSALAPSERGLSPKATGGVLRDKRQSIGRMYQSSQFASSASPACHS